MTNVDWMVVLAYVAGILAVGFIASRIVRSAADMFKAGGESPWWLSGLSGYMTMFSAGTFVVWGGIAYTHGLVAVAICMCYGVAALLVGWFVAAHWKRLGVSTPAEFIRLRFGPAAVQFYIWLNMAGRMFGMGVALYALGVMLGALIPLGEGHPLRDPVTGHLAPAWAVVLCGSIVVLYTVSGGLWAVLIVDAMQFVVLTLCVLFVAPLILIRAGGPAAFVRAVPEGFLSPTAGDFTWWFLVGWTAIHVFKIGAEWAFAQRYICVPDERSARKSAFLFGALYLVTPVLWMAPALVYRVLEPAADPEQAYILACRLVLPAGMVGMMLAAMFSATASSVSSELNVFGGVLTHDVYRALIHPRASEKTLVLAGRVFATLLGAVVMAVAVAVPRLGGAEGVVLSVTALIAGPLLLPTLWGLFSRRATHRCVWPTALISFAVGGALRFGLARGGRLAGIAWLSGVAEWTQQHPRMVELIAGVGVPLAVLVAMEAASRGVSEGWIRVAQRAEVQRGVAARPASSLPARIMAWCLAACGGIMAVLTAFAAGERTLLAIFALCLFALAAVMLTSLRRAGARAEPSLGRPMGDGS